MAEIWHQPKGPVDRHHGFGVQGAGRGCQHGVEGTELLNLLEEHQSAVELIGSDDGERSEQRGEVPRQGRRVAARSASAADVGELLDDLRRSGGSHGS